MPERLGPDDVSQAARRLGCDVAALKAVIAVESSGSGFDAQGRPRVLFEPHYFWKLLPEGPLRDQAVAQGLAYEHWQPGRYPHVDGVWKQIEAACEISEDAALQSCSWGLGQIMGIHWQGSIYNSVADLVCDMAKSEKAQLDLMVGFIIRNNLDRHLRDLNWAAFARSYNGPRYAENDYDEKLANEYAKAAAQG